MDDRCIITSSDIEHRLDNVYLIKWLRSLAVRPKLVDLPIAFSYEKHV